MAVSSDRLILRECRTSDVEAVLAYRSRLDVACYLRSGVWTRERCEHELSNYAAAAFDNEGDELVLLAEEPESAAVIGEVGLVWLEGSPATAEIGYVVNPAFGGQGFATEAVRRVIDLAFNKYGFECVIAKTDASNHTSRALCERIEMRLHAITTSTDGRNVPECTYVLSAK